MHLRTVKTIFLKELKDVLRDRRTLFIMIVLPILLYPLLLIGFLQLTTLQMAKLEKKQSRVALIGRENAGGLGRVLDTLAGVRLFDSMGWRSRLIVGELDAAIRIPASFVDSVQSGGSTNIDLYYNSSKEVSLRARERMKDATETFKQQVVSDRLSKFAADTSILRPFTLHSENVATEEQRQGDMLGRFLGYLLIIMTVMGAFYPAIDLTAGEKERGTLETLLVSPASRSEIVYGKFLAVMVIAMITALLNLLSIGGTALFAVDMLGKLAQHAMMGIAISPLSLILALLQIIPLATLSAAMLLAIAVSARNYKEGQSLLTPIYTAMIMPAMISMVPGIEMNPTLAVVPIVNVSLLIKEYMVGNYLWLETIIAFLSTSTLAVVALVWATDQFRQEAVIFRHAEDVRWSPFRRKVGLPNVTYPSPGSALLFLAIAMLLLFYGGGLKQDRSVAESILFSQALIIGLVLIGLYRGRHDFRKTLSLRLPRFAAWPAVIVLMAGGWLIAIELAALQNQLMPFPPEFLQRFTKLFSELNALPAWQSIFLLAILPGICEECFCRGFILSAFTPRFGKIGAIILTAVAFGFLHLDSYRLLATTFLGLLLGAIVVLTGSIFPAMLAHAMNNTASFLAQRYQDQLGGLAWLNIEAQSSLPWYICAIGFVMIVIGLLWLDRIGKDRAVTDTPRAQIASIGPNKQSG